MAATTAMNGWGYTGPLDETEGNARSFITSNDPLDRPIRTVPRRTSALDLQSDSEATHGRKTSTRSSASASAGRKRSRNALRDKLDTASQSANDDSKWIHRDKLAEIEIREMEEAGYHVRPSRRSMSTGATERARRSSRSGSQDRQTEYSNEDGRISAYPTYDDIVDRRRISTIPSQNGDDRGTDLDHHDVDEDATHHQEHGQRTIRPSTSRIPISTNGLPSSQGDRESVPGSRAGGGPPVQNWDDLHNAKRNRVGSMSSQVMLEDSRTQQITPPGSNHKSSSNGDNASPKPRTTKKTTPNGRKPSTTDASLPASAQTKNGPPGKRSDTSPEKKFARPSSSHDKAPEGDPPWMMSMYKPDPRLPPDQQMLPTHAKRLAQEQWEREGKGGSAYDREFRPLNDDDPSPKPKAAQTAQQPSVLDLPAVSDPTTKQLPHLQIPPSLSAQHSDIIAFDGTSIGAPHELTKHDITRGTESSSRPGTSGGYRITPTISTPPALDRPSPVRPNAISPVTHNATPRMPELDEKAEAQTKKGCCCVVM